MPEAVLFDLDGTLADTAPDLGAALNRVRQDYNLPPLPLDTLRPHTSQGGRGLLRVGMGVTPQDDSYAELYRRFIQHYEERLCHHTTLFPGMAELLAQLEQRRIPWGVVTNKSERLTHPLLQQMDLAHRCACIVCGDSTPNPKPAPDPLLLAAQLLGLPPPGLLLPGRRPAGHSGRQRLRHDDHRRPLGLSGHGTPAGDLGRRPPDRPPRRSIAPARPGPLKASRLAAPGLRQISDHRPLKFRGAAPIMLVMVVIPAIWRRSGRGFDSRHLHLRVSESS